MSRTRFFLGRARTLAVRAFRRTSIVRPWVCFLVTDPAGDGIDLDTTLHALRALPGADLLVLVAAAPGSASATAGRVHADSDWRVRSVETGDWSAAARAAARMGSRHVVVLRAGDLPDPAGVDACLRSLDGGQLGRRLGRRLGVGSGLRLADPSAAVFDRAGWRSAEDAPSPTVALARALAKSPDAVRLSTPVVRPGAASSVRGMPDTRPELAAWLEAQREASGLLADDVALHSDWATSALAGDAQRFLEDVERFDDDEWGALQACIADLAATSGSAGLPRIPAEGRVRVALAAADRRSDLVAFVVSRRLAAGQFATNASDGAVHAVLPVPRDLPDDLTLLAPSETALHTSVRRLRWVDDLLAIEVFACVAGVDLLQDRPEVTAALVGSGGQRLDVAVDLVADREVTRWMGTHHVNHDPGVLRMHVPAAALAVAGRWSLEVTVSVAGLTRTGMVTAHDPGGSASVLRPRTYAGVAVGAALDPEFALVAAARPAGTPATGAVAVDDVTLADGALTIRGAGVEELQLSGPRGAVEPEIGPGTASWSLLEDPWGFGPQPVATGRYVLTRRDDRGIDITERLGDRLPDLVLTDDHRAVVRLERRADGHALVVSLGPPLADDEVGPYCQRRLQEWYADPSAHELDPAAVYLQAYTGQNATDSPLAIAEELASSRPDLALTWAVADRASRVPAGSQTVLWRSRAWYAALARSRYVVTNIELESWFRRRPGQQVLQTFHGYPSKAMGLGLWRTKNFTESRVEQQLDRTSRNWTLLLTPTPEMDVHYRENYRYDGEILAAGYPRDDVLVSPRADAVRAETRERLGIADDTVAVLYAPTWRDDQALDFRSALMIDHLDVAATAEALGPGYVLLLRGHRFMSATGRSGSRVVDVTGYPEVNDLILAADVAVLDYSSMRFDFALTGRPMVFLVPDLESYATAKRGFLYEFRPTAPGPLARSSAEVIEALRDLDDVRARHREDYERFNATYNRFQDGRAAQRTVARFFV